MRTEIGLVNTPELWLTTLLIIAVAVIGKFAGSAFTARILGESWKDSLCIGVLMNTRGLMELIVLNIGYEMGILPPAVFVMLVIMALVTTFMTTPLLSFIEKVFPQKNVQEEYERVCFFSVGVNSIGLYYSAHWYTCTFRGVSGWCYYAIHAIVSQTNCG